MSSNLIYDIKGNPEHKWFCSNADNDIEQIPDVLVNCLNPIYPGDGVNERTGRKITMTKIELTIDIYPTDSVTLSGIGPWGINSTKARIALVYDRQANGLLIDFKDVFEDVLNDGTVSSEIWSGVNLNNRHRFQILYDEKFTLNSYNGEDETVKTLAFGNFAQQQLKHIYFKTTDLVTIYNNDDTVDPTTDEGNIMTGTLWLMMSTEPQDRTPEIDLINMWKVRQNCRIRYTDM